MVQVVPRSQRNVMYQKGSLLFVPKLYTHLTMGHALQGDSATCSKLAAASGLSMMAAKRYKQAARKLLEVGASVLPVFCVVLSCIWDTLPCKGATRKLLEVGP